MVQHTLPTIHARDLREVDFHAIQRSFTFWSIIISLGFTLWLAALETSVLVTAAPAVLEEIPLGPDWIWLTNAFFLCSAAFQPLLGQLAGLFGRRWLTMGVIAIFMLGSGICGGAHTKPTLLAGRAVQGIGSGGITMAYDIVVSDLVPLRYRGNYIAIILMIYSIGMTMGPVLGGVFADYDWRWAFWINLPVGAVCIIVLYFCLNVSHRRDTHWFARLRRIDGIGNAILMGGCVSMLIALTYAGTLHPWGSWQTLVPLLIGFAALFVFCLYESSKRFGPVEPVAPWRLFNNRTSAVIGVNTFLYNAIVYWSVFFIPVYFQSVQILSPIRAGVNMIPVTLLSLPSAAAAAAAVTKWGKYKAIHIAGYTLFTVGMGLWALADEDTPIGEWVGYMFAGPIGAGLLLNTQLPAFQAPASEEDQGAATAAWNFIRTLGAVWGVAIPAAIFASEVDSLVMGGAVSNPVAAAALVGGGAYQFASAEFVTSFPDLGDQAEIRRVYRLAIHRVFQCGVAFSAFAWLLSFFESDVPLRTELVTDFGLEEQAKDSSQPPTPQCNS
jgi:MFS family permease